MGADKTAAWEKSMNASSTSIAQQHPLHPGSRPPSAHPRIRPHPLPPNMFRPASRAVVRAASSSPRALGRAPAAQRRLISTTPPTQKSRSWKSSLARWGIAGAAIYYYNTSNVFAEEPACMDSHRELSHVSAHS